MGTFSFPKLTESTRHKTSVGMGSESVQSDPSPIFWTLIFLNAGHFMSSTKKKKDA